LGQFQYHLREIMNDKSLGEPVWAPLPLPLKKT
jgi:hypothetical protein